MNKRIMMCAALSLEHRAPDGLIAVHISNRYINFMPLMRAVMNEFNLHGVLICHDADFNDFANSTEWVIFSPSSKNMSDDLWQNDTFDEYPESTRIWTDDYSNLISLFW